MQQTTESGSCKHHRHERCPVSTNHQHTFTLDSFRHSNQTITQQNYPHVTASVTPIGYRDNCKSEELVEKKLEK